MQLTKLFFFFFGCSFSINTEAYCKYNLSKARITCIAWAQSSKKSNSVFQLLRPRKTEMQSNRCHIKLHGHAPDSLQDASLPRTPTSFTFTTASTVTSEGDW